MNRDSEDCVRSGTVGVHQRLRGLPLVTSLLQDGVDLGLGVDLDLLQPLDDDGPLLVGVLVQPQLGRVVHRRRQQVEDLLVVQLQEGNLNTVLEVIRLSLDKNTSEIDESLSTEKLRITFKLSRI